MFDKIWKIRNNKIDISNAYLSEDFYFEELLKEVNTSDIDKFLNPSLDNLDDYNLLPDYIPASERITAACENNETICVFGDYDVDGITATAIMYHFLKTQMDANVFYKIPERKDGFGLSVSSVEEIKNDFNPTLIITVDNGTSAKEAIMRAAELGIDVVVTDHHDVTDELPECIAVVNPNVTGSNYPTKDLCGAGVAFKLIMGIAFDVGLDDEYLMYLPFAAIGTIADVVNLTGENRIIVKFGLEMIKSTDFPGLKALFKNEIENGTPITTTTIGYQVGPRLNAAGRIGSPEISCELLLATRDYEAEDIFKELDNLNAKRREIEEKTIAEANIPDNIVLSKNDCMIIVKNIDWASGIAGNVAGKLLTKYQKPVFVLTKDKEDEDGVLVWKASARSTDLVNIMDVILYCKDLLVKYGGHPKAAGFSVREDKLAEFAGKIKEYFATCSLSYVPVKEAYSVLPDRLLTFSLCDKLSKLEPFGEGNKEPLFLVENLDNINATTFGGKKDHLSLSVSLPNRKNYTFKKFSAGSYAPYFFQGIRGGVISKLDKNYFRGKVSLDIFFEDFIENYTDRIDLDTCFKLTEHDVNVIYLIFVKNADKITIQDIIIKKANIINDPNVTNEQKNILTWFKIFKTFEIFNELGLLQKDGSDYIITNNGNVKKLIESKLYSELSR